MDLGPTYRIRPFQYEDGEQVRELFRLGIGHGYTSARASALRATLKRPQSIAAYIITVAGIFLAVCATDPDLRIAGFCAAILSASHFIVRRWLLGRWFVFHAGNVPDLQNTGEHYGVTMKEAGGSSVIPGRAGFWVAEKIHMGKPTKEIIGCVGLDDAGSDPSVATLRRMAVSDTMQRKGIGKRLIEEALDHAARRNIKTVNLTTSPHQPSAVGIYKKFGWELIAERPQPWIDLKLVDFRLNL